MYIEEGEIIGYKYEVYYNGSCLHEDDEIFETEEEAEEDAREWCRDRVDQWMLDGAELDGNEYNDLINGIVVEEEIC